MAQQEYNESNSQAGWFMNASKVTKPQDNKPSINNSFISGYKKVANSKSFAVPDRQKPGTAMAHTPKLVIGDIPLGSSRNQI